MTSFSYPQNTNKSLPSFINSKVTHTPKPIPKQVNSIDFPFKEAFAWVIITPKIDNKTPPVYQTPLKWQRLWVLSTKYKIEFYKTKNTSEAVLIRLDVDDIIALKIKEQLTISSQLTTSANSFSYFEVEFPNTFVLFGSPPDSTERDDWLIHLKLSSHSIKEKILQLKEKFKQQKQASEQKGRNRSVAGSNGSFIGNQNPITNNNTTPINNSTPNSETATTPSSSNSSPSNQPPSPNSVGSSSPISIRNPNSPTEESSESISPSSAVLKPHPWVSSHRDRSVTTSRSLPNITRPALRRESSEKHIATWTKTEE